MTSKPASRRARATIFAPRSWPSRPGFATITRYFCGIAASVADPVLRPGELAAQDARRGPGPGHAVRDRPGRGVHRLSDVRAGARRPRLAVGLAEQLRCQLGISNR